ncbi:MAG: GNAT family acetyltransferase [Desulfosarcinaceae bacterium]
MLEIRPFKPEEEKEVIALWQTCGLVVAHNNPARDIARKRAVNPEWFLVGLLDGRLAATCMAGYEGHRGWINYLAVLPDCRRRGLATAMVREAEQLLKEAGCPKINLQIRETNETVIAFYSKIGYTRDPVISMGRRLIPD